MKINNSYNKYLQSVQQAKKHVKTQSSQANVKRTAKKNVEVNISQEAKRLSEASSAEAHSVRIEEIKAAIQDGTYEIKPQETAEGIMREIDRQKGSGD